MQSLTTNRRVERKPAGQWPARIFAGWYSLWLIALPAGAHAAKVPSEQSMSDATLAMCPTLGARRDSDFIQQSAEEAQLNDFCDALVGGAFGGSDDNWSMVNGEEMQNVQSQVTKIRDLQNGSIFARLEALRSGKVGRGIDVAGLRLDVSDQTMLGGAGSDQLLDENSVFQNVNWPRLGIFLSGGVRFGDKDATGQAGGFSFDARGVTIGADYRLTDQLVLGAAVGYTNFDIDFDTTSASVAGQDLSSDGVTFAGFGTYYPSDRFFVDGVLSLGWTSYDSTRRIVAISNDPAVDSVDATTKGDFDAFYYGASSNFGYDYPLTGSLLLTPSLRLDYVKAEIDGFSESADESDEVSLAFGDQDAESLTSQLGVELSRKFSTDLGVITPSFRATYIHEFLGDDEGVKVKYKADPTNLSEFELPTEGRDRHYTTLGANVTATLPNGFSTFADYGTVLGLRDFDIHSISIGLRKELGSNF